MQIYAIITAGGTSSRYGNTNKLLEKINSKEVIRHTIDKFLACPQIDAVIVSANASIKEIIADFYKNEPRVKVIEGGIYRQESVHNALKFSDKADYVLIHDGARPMISSDKIVEVIESVKTCKAITVAARTIDTIKLVDENLKIIKTVDRSNLFNTQTPQAFDYKTIMQVHEKLKGQNFTDDAGMLESLGYDVFVLEGDYNNIKITNKSDIIIAEAYL